MFKPASKASVGPGLRPAAGRQARVGTPGSGRAIVALGLAGFLGAVLAIIVAAAPLPAAADEARPGFSNGRNQFTFFRPLRQAAQVPLLASDGSLLTVKRFRGKVVLLNLWATWCPPCIEELPSLDRLQEALGTESLAVVALSVDEGEEDLPFAYADRLGLEQLEVAHDFSGRARDAFPLYGMPVTYLIDREGFVVGYLVGAAVWDSPAAIAFLRHYTEGG
jgi:thiol-disulfide isomerase/thioredoxin